MEKYTIHSRFTLGGFLLNPKPNFDSGFPLGTSGQTQNAIQTMVILWEYTESSENPI